MCVQVGGKSIRHFLKASITQITAEYIVPEASRPFKFTHELDTKFLGSMITVDVRGVLLRRKASQVFLCINRNQDLR